jgi:PAS domain S-box-containing protein
MILVSVSICGLISWTYIRQGRDMVETMDALNSIRQTRIDLAKGFLYISREEEFLFSREQGMSLLRQAVRSFRDSISWLSENLPDKPDIPDDVPAFIANIEEFSTLLSVWDTDEDSRHLSEARIRIAFHSIDAQAAGIDRLVQQASREQRRKYDIEFLVILWLSSVFLAGLSIIMFLINRAKEQSEATLKEYRILLNEIIDNASSLIYLFDKEGRCLLANRAYAELFGLPPEELLGKKRSSWMPEELERKHHESDRTVMASGKSQTFEEESAGEDGTRYLTVKFPLRDQSAAPYAVGGISTDISPLKKTERQLTEALREKEVLLRELYHRTKNNMQVIQSILNLQSEHSENEEVKMVLKEAGFRILSMALVHQKLYESKNPQPSICRSTSTTSYPSSCRAASAPMPEYPSRRTLHPLPCPSTRRSPADLSSTNSYPIPEHTPSRGAGTARYASGFMPGTEEE